MSLTIISPSTIVSLRIKLFDYDSAKETIFLCFLFNHLPLHLSLIPPLTDSLIGSLFQKIPHPQSQWLSHLLAKLCNDSKGISRNASSIKIIVLPKGFVQYKTIRTIIINSDLRTNS